MFYTLSAYIQNWTLHLLNLLRNNNLSLKLVKKSEHFVKRSNKTKMQRKINIIQIWSCYTLQLHAKITNTHVNISLKLKNQNLWLTYFKSFWEMSVQSNQFKISFNSNKCSEK